jgi:hypothetical protein
MSLFRRIASFRQLPPAERGITRAALRLLWPLRIGLFFRGVPRGRTRLGESARRMLRERTTPDAPELAPRRTARLVETAAAYVWPTPSCLHRSLVLEALLHAQGVPADVRFGVRRRGSVVEGHAWVEHDGEALTPPGDDHADDVPFVTAKRRT